MKKGRYTNTGVRCPYYRGQNNWVIFCKGPKRDGDFSIHLAAPGPGERRNWQKEFCGYDSRRGRNIGRSDYESCPIYRMVTELTGEEDPENPDSGTKDGNR